MLNDPINPTATSGQTLRTGDYNDATARRSRGRVDLSLGEGTDSISCSDSDRFSIGLLAFAWNAFTYWLFRNTHTHSGHSHSHSFGHDIGELGSGLMHPAEYRQAMTAVSPALQKQEIRTVVGE